MNADEHNTEDNLPSGDAATNDRDTPPPELLKLWEEMATLAERDQAKDG
jgi:hypothetical protein